MPLVYRSHSGFSLLELMLVLGVIAALTIAAFVVYPKVEAGSNADTERANIEAMVAGVKNLYAGTGDYGSLNVDVANTSHIIPPTLNGGDYDAGTPIINMWGGVVDVTNSAIRPNTHFDITYTNLPQHSCVALVAAIQKNHPFASAGASVAAAQATPLKDAFDLAGGGVIPFDPSLVGPACSNANNAVVITTR